MLPRTSPTKATSGVAFHCAVHRSPDRGERPTAGSDEGNSSRGIAGKPCLPETTHNPRPQKLGKFKQPASRDPVTMNPRTGRGASAQA